MTIWSPSRRWTGRSPDVTQQAFIFHPGRHYVVYSDGCRTKLMRRSTATTYAKIFGGVVRRDPGRLKRLLALWMGPEGGVRG